MSLKARRAVLLAAICGALTLIPVIGVSHAVAAVRSCKPAVASEIARADTEMNGKRKALQSWGAKVAKIGPGFTNWRIADAKVLGCKPARAPLTGFECIAYAAPCTITQAPGQPKKRLRAPGANKPIET